MLKMIADSAGFATVIVVDFAVFLEDNSRLHLMPSSSRRNVVDPRTVGLAFFDNLEGDLCLMNIPTSILIALFLHIPLIPISLIACPTYTYESRSWGLEITTKNRPQPHSTSLTEGPTPSRSLTLLEESYNSEDTTKEELVIQKEEMELESAQSSTTAKLPLLKQGDYEIWRLRIEQYFQIQDYALWDVIENGNSFKPVAGQQQMMLVPQLQLYPVSLLLKRRLKRRMMSKQEYKDAKTLFAAIETRFGGNEATKKTQKTLLKQLYKSDLDTISIDDLYNNFKIVKQEVNGSTSTTSSSQNLDFMSSPSPNSTSEVPTAYEVSTASTQSSTASTQVSTANLSDAIVYAFLSNQSNGSQLIHEDLEQIHEDDNEEICMKWQLVLLSMRAKRECKQPRNQDSRSWNQESSRRTVNVEEIPPKAMVSIDGVGFDWSYMAEDESCETESKNASKEITNELKESPDAPLVDDKVSDNKDFSVKSPVVVEMKTVILPDAKIEFVKAKQQEKPVRKTVKYVEMYRSQGPRGNQRN
nr:ribonuclease H-like domain-containing protein [Tanacetum cinerariifolium]